MIFKRTLFATAACALLSAPYASAQAMTDYPNRPLRMIVPFAPGGSTDLVARVIQPAMADLLKQQIVVDNRPGAAGNIGVEVGARASPDGHTLLLGNVGTMAINPVYYTKFQYKPLKDLIPITLLVDVPGSLVVHPALPAKSVKELIAYMKANPNKLNFGSPTASSANSLEARMFLNATGTTATEVPYKGGAGPATVGLLANEVQFMFATFSSTQIFAKQGRLRMLGIVAPERSASMPDIPTMREQGFDMVVGSWQGLLVPKGTPTPVVNTLFKVGTEAMNNAAVVKRMNDSGVIIVTSKSPADFTAFIKNETNRFGKAIRDNNIQTE